MQPPEFVERSRNQLLKIQAGALKALFVFHALRRFEPLRR